jgi:Mg-chelatase subunit ChlD
MRNIYRLPLLLLSAITILIGARPAAAQSTLLTFPEVPCDSLACDSLMIVNSTAYVDRIVTLRFRDGTDFTIDSSVVRPDSIKANDRLALHICFSPTKRGTITDSLLIVRLGFNGIDSIKVRLTGRGVGPEISVDPTVLNFPKTNSGSSSTLKLKIVNSGERTYTLDATKINIPPPFRLVTPLPIDIAPGDTIELDIAFEPTADGVYSITVDMKGGCVAKVQIGLNGATSLTGTGAVLRQSKLGFNPANNEEATCSVSRCTDLILTNFGNATLIIDSLAWTKGTTGYSIVPPPTLPILIAANQQSTLQVCLDSRTRGMLRDTLVIGSNTRSPIAFGLVIDVSGSMSTNNLDCGPGNQPTRMDQARAQAQDFLDKTLLYIPSILQDQIAVSRFSGSVVHIYPLSFVTPATRAAAKLAVQNNTPSAGTTYTGAALRSMIDTLAKSPLQDRVIVLLTDGNAIDLGTNTSIATTIANLAKGKGVRIFTIGIGSTGLSTVGKAQLNTFTNITGGAIFDGNNCDSLQQAFESITDIVSRGTVNREPFAIKINAPLLVTSGGLKFDSLYIHGQACDTITLTNVGEGDAIVDNIAFSKLVGGPSNEFFLPPGITTPFTIPENGQLRVPVCFSPTGIRQRAATADFNYNNCGQSALADSLHGIGYAIANLRINDERAALPGSIVTMPVYGDSSLAEYEVNTITYSVRWNRTMLDLRAIHPGTAAAGATVTMPLPVVYDDRYATAQVVVSGNGIDSRGELAQLEFQVLRGDTLATLVELTAGKFEDNNPRTILDNAGLVAYDSTCFRSQKGITSQSASKVVAGEASPSPSTSDVVTIPLTSSVETLVKVEIYSMSGTLVVPATTHRVKPGSSIIPIDLEGIPDGSYYARLSTADGETLFRKIIRVR